MEKTRLQVQQRKNDQEYELQKEKITLEHERETNKMREDKTADSVVIAPQLPMFIDGKDDLDSYLERFERFAKIQKLENSNFAIALSALLSGKALEVYARLSRKDATDYTKIKTALLKSYNLTEEGFRQKFRNSKLEENESPNSVHRTTISNIWQEA